MGQAESRDSEQASVAFADDVSQKTPGRARIIGASGSSSSAGANSGARRANLKSELDNISTGSIDSGAHDDDDGFENALEYGLGMA